MLSQGKTAFKHKRLKKLKLPTALTMLVLNISIMKQKITL